MASTGRPPPPSVKPRAVKRSAIYDVPKSQVRLSKTSPHKIQPTETLNRELSNPSSTVTELPPDFPREDEIFSLTTFVDKYSHLIPLRVKAVSGFMAENEGDPTICVDDVYNIHAVKQTEVVTIIDSRKQKYSLPLHSAAKFGLIGDSAETLSAFDLQNAFVLPPVLATMSKYDSVYPAYRFSENEILLPMSVVPKPQGAGWLVKVLSVHKVEEKFISDKCNILFSTHPAVTKLYLSDIVNHASHLLPCKAQLFISQAQAKLPKHLTAKQVTLHPKHTETSLIITFNHPRGNWDDKVYIDIPVSIDIDVRVLRPESSYYYVALYQDSDALVKEYDPKKLHACVNANDDDTYVTQAQLLKALRQGYETAGTKIKTSGVDHIYQPLDDGTTETSNVYQGMTFPDAKQSPVNHQESTVHPGDSSAPDYEDMSYNSYQPPTVPPCSTVSPPPTAPRTKISRVPQEHSKISPLPSPRDKKVPSSSGSSSSLQGHPNPATQHKLAPQTPLTQSKAPLASPLPPPARYQKLLNTGKPDTVPNCSLTAMVKPVQTARESPQNTLPLPPKTRGQQPVVPPPRGSVSSIQQDAIKSEVLGKQEPSRGSVSSIQQEAIKSEVSGKQETKSGASDTPHQSDQALQAISQSLHLLLAKVEKIEKRQTKFEADMEQLKGRKSSTSPEKDLPMEIHSMTQQDVLKLLEAIGLSQYKEAFSSEWVDGEVFKDLDEESLQELGVASKLHRLKLMKVITGAYPLDKVFSS